MRKTELETKDTSQENRRCLLPNHADFAGSSCVVCGQPVPRVPWTSAEYAQHGRKREAPVWNGIEPTPDPADAGVPKSPELVSAEAAVAEASAVYRAALGDLLALDRVLGNLFGTNAAGLGGQIAGDPDETKRDQAQRMRPQALEVVEETSTALLAARIEVLRLSRIRDANRRQWHADRQEALAAANAAKAATARSTPFRSFVERLGR